MPASDFKAQCFGFKERIEHFISVDSLDWKLANENLYDFWNTLHDDGGSRASKELSDEDWELCAQCLRDVESMLLD